jgi:hypothetical protein
MRDYDHAPAEEDSRSDEYDELVQLIVHAPWHPGALVRTSKGSTWRFRETPYTSEFPEVTERQASGKTRAHCHIRW